MHVNVYVTVNHTLDVHQRLSMKLHESRALSILHETMSATCSTVSFDMMGTAVSSVSCFVCERPRTFGYWRAVIG